MTPQDIVESEQYQLDRQATALKKAGDLDGAIAALQKRKALLGVQYDDFKLAKYLQAAGRLDDALAEIQWLVDRSHARASELFGHQPPSVRLLAHTVHTAQAYGAAALICKRAKRPELAAKYEASSQQYWALRERLDPLAKNDQKARRAAHAEQIAQLRGAASARRDGQQS
jgi:hypothetical protein